MLDLHSKIWPFALIPFAVCLLRAQNSPRGRQSGYPRKMLRKG